MILFRLWLGVYVNGVITQHNYGCVSALCISASIAASPKGPPVADSATVSVACVSVSVSTVACCCIFPCCLAANSAVACSRTLGALQPHTVPASLQNSTLIWPPLPNEATSVFRTLGKVPICISIQAATSLT